MTKFFLIAYFLFLLVFSLFSYLFIDPNFLYLKDFFTDFAFMNREFVTILYIVFVLILFLFYFKILKGIGILQLKKFRTLVVLTIIGLIFSYPAFLSFDIFNYIATAKTLFFYGENPYIVMPIEFAGDPILGFTHAANKVALYGPFWIALIVIPYFAGFGNFLITLFSFKLFIALFYLGTVYILWLMTRDLFKTALFSFNPLVLIETLMSSHNDIVMIFLALLSFYFLTKKKILLAVLFIILSILIKYATVFLLPIFICNVFKILKGEKINWRKIFMFSFISMLTIFLLSPLREEIYPWYAIWFLPFAILSKNKLIIYVLLAFTFGLLFRYIPFMLFGTHFGITPIVKTLVTFTPPLLVLAYLYLKERRWSKIFR